jgi:hypothetical protein
MVFKKLKKETYVANLKSPYKSSFSIGYCTVIPISPNTSTINLVHSVLNHTDVYFHYNNTKLYMNRTSNTFIYGNISTLQSFFYENLIQNKLQINITSQNYPLGEITGVFTKIVEESSPFIKPITWQT